MRISAKGRYALAAMISIAQTHDSGRPVTVIHISETLGISKIYLEQVFSLLKRGGLVNSIKGAQGGYQLARPPRQISPYDILSAVELSLFESAEDTVSHSAPEIENTMRDIVLAPMDCSIRETLTKSSLYDLAAEAERCKSGNEPMFYI